MLTPEKKTKLEKASRIGKQVKHKKKRGPGSEIVGTVVDEVYIIVSDYKHLIQKIKFKEGQGWGGNEYAYRTGYYTYDAGYKNIKWGQYTQFLTASEYKELLNKAISKGWEII